MWKGPNYLLCLFLFYEFSISLRGTGGFCHPFVESNWSLTAWLYLSDLQVPHIEYDNTVVSLGLHCKPWVGLTRPEDSVHSVV